MSNLIKVVLCCLAIMTLSFPVFADEDQSSAAGMSEEAMAPADEDQSSAGSMSEEDQMPADEDQSSEDSMSEEDQPQASGN